jgi:hypothetical protein
MIRPGEPITLTGGRWVPFKPFEIDVEWVNLTGATLAMQVRLTRDTPGAPLISLTNQTSPAEGISVSVTTVDGLPLSTIEIRINETTMEGLPAASELGDDLELFWDMHITPSGGTKAVWAEGPFIVKGGAVQ